MVQSHVFLPAETTPQSKSALRESNPPVQLGRLTPLPIGQEHKAEREGVEPPRPGTRAVGGSTVFKTAAIAHLACPSVLQSTKSCGGRNRTCVGAVNSRLPVPTRIPPQNKVRMAGFEPAVSCARRPCSARCPAEYQAFLHPASPKQVVLLVNILRRSPTNRRARDSEERPAGVEPALPPWQGDRLPLHHGRVVVCRIVNEQEHRERLELSSPHYGCGILAAGRPVPSITLVGPDGLEPSPARVRTECAAANTLIPCCSQWGRRDSNPRRARLKLAVLPLHHDPG